jgi:hypothetical protein
MEAAMSEQSSPVFPLGPSVLGGELIPALMGCPHCRTARMIAAPELGLCADCGAQMKVLSADEI